jgi:hypothetical protein
LVSPFSREFKAGLGGWEQQREPQENTRQMKHAHLPKTHSWANGLSSFAQNPKMGHKG